VSAPTFYLFQLLLRCYDYYMHVEGPVPTKLRLVTLVSLVQCLQFDIFRLQHVQIASKTLRFKTKLIGNNAEVSRVNRNTL